MRSAHLDFGVVEVLLFDGESTPSSARESHERDTGIECHRFRGNPSRLATAADADVIRDNVAAAAQHPNARDNVTSQILKARRSPVSGGSTGASLVKGERRDSMTRQVVRHESNVG